MAGGRQRQQPRCLAYHNLLSGATLLLMAGQGYAAWGHQQSLCAALQIGQIMLSIPNAYAKMGLAAGLCLSIGSGFVSAYTIILLVHLYEERKRRLVSRAA